MVQNSVNLPLSPFTGKSRTAQIPMVLEISSPCGIPRGVLAWENVKIWEGCGISFQNFENYSIAVIMIIVLWSITQGYLGYHSTNLKEFLLWKKMLPHKCRPYKQKGEGWEKIMFQIFSTHGSTHSLEKRNFEGILGIFLHYIHLTAILHFKWSIKEGATTPLQNIWAPLHRVMLDQKCDLPCSML